MTKIYLATLFSRRPQMEIVADMLKAKGYEITARWVYGGEHGLTRAQIATLDLDDVDACDTVISFTLPYGTAFTSGGRHVEFGYGLAKGKDCIVIGDRENVFHHDPRVKVYPNIDGWLAARDLSRRRQDFLAH